MSNYDHKRESCDKFRSYIKEHYGNDMSTMHLELVKALAVVWSRA